MERNEIEVGQPVWWYDQEVIGFGPFRKIAAIVVKIGGTTISIAVLRDISEWHPKRVRCTSIQKREIPNDGSIE